MKNVIAMFLVMFSFIGCAHAQMATANPDTPQPVGTPVLPTTLPPPPTAADQTDSTIINANPPDAIQGQWIYTADTGWVWAPYAQNFTYVNPAGDLAFEYVFYPSFGFRWIAAPWILGYGIQPYYGSIGPRYFAYRIHPWFHVGVYRPELFRQYNVRGGFVSGRTYNNPYNGGRGDHPAYRGGNRSYGGRGGHGHR